MLLALLSVDEVKNGRMYLESRSSKELVRWSIGGKEGVGGGELETGKRGRQVGAELDSAA